MTLDDAFERFFEQIQPDDRTEREKTAAAIARKLTDAYYGSGEDASCHVFVVGSAGRGTDVRGTSDLDVIFALPQAVFHRFDTYRSQKQTALLQEVKRILQERYPRTAIRGDGQVVAIAFGKYDVELVPAFLLPDGSFRFPDTHEGGSWAVTKPLEEQRACEAFDRRSYGRYRRMCQAVRVWKNYAGIPMGGLLIDTLVYQCFSRQQAPVPWRAGYDVLLRRFFSYLAELDEAQSYWYAVGSRQKVYHREKGAFIRAARDVARAWAEQPAPLASFFRELLFGRAFPAAEHGLLAEDAFPHDAEAFIEDLVPVDIRHALRIVCHVVRRGFRTWRFGTGCPPGRRIPVGSALCFTLEPDLAGEYDVYWKVRNRGLEAMRQGALRGEIRQGARTHRETAAFAGDHYIEAYLVRHGACVARARLDVPVGG